MGAWTRTWAVSTRGTDANAWNRPVHVSQSRCARPCLKLRRGWFTWYPSWCCRQSCGLAKGTEGKQAARMQGRTGGTYASLPFVYFKCLRNLALRPTVGSNLRTRHSTTHHSRPPLTEPFRPAASSSGRSIASNLPPRSHQRPLWCLGLLGGQQTGREISRVAYTGSVHVVSVNKDALSFAACPGRSNNCLNAGVGAMGWATLSQR
ncbi:hypothetical protein CGRA01v4_07580 [Colletotrichum graminicola]|nr:hypothetical protein CGRA01v4_07580 [Colletotrichum graminicola]